MASALLTVKLVCPGKRNGFSSPLPLSQVFPNSLHLLQIRNYDYIYIARADLMAALLQFEGFTLSKESGEVGRDGAKAARFLRPAAGKRRADDRGLPEEMALA
jgi:hypothetical protein